MADSDLTHQDFLVARSADSALAFQDGSLIRVADFIRDVVDCSRSLPDGRYVVDRSNDRYQFTVRFYAALLGAKVNLLPTQRDVATLRALDDGYGDVLVLDSATAPSSDRSDPMCHGLPAVASRLPTRPLDALAVVTEPEEPAAIAFTSGTTGRAQAHRKSWAMLAAFRDVHWRYLSSWLHGRGADGSEVGLVATVPPWHMYGLEWTVLLPTIAPVTLHCGEAFYPKDVAAALDRFDGATLLVTTPTHLRALLKSPAPRKPVTLTMCATSPLDPALTRRVEQHLRTRIVDLYGCSEIGSLATRHPMDSPAWSFFDCFDLHFNDGRLSVATAHLPNPVALGDSFVRLGGREFRMEGRATDTVKIGGKRESLARLNNLLLAIPGVEDGLVYQPELLGLPERGRLAAVVVAPGLNASTIRTELAKRMDSTFVPRPIRLVDTLPREESSKLPAQALRRLVTGS